MTVLATHPVAATDATGAAVDLVDEAGSTIALLGPGPASDPATLIVLTLPGRAVRAATLAGRAGPFTAPGTAIRRLDLPGA